MGYKGGGGGSGASSWDELEDKPQSSVAAIDAAVSASHSQNTDEYLDYGGDNQVSAEDTKKVLVCLNKLSYFRNLVNMQLELPATVVHTNTDADSLNTAIAALSEGAILEVQTDATYNPITIPGNKGFTLRAGIGRTPTISGTECIKLMNGARDVILSGLIINSSSTTQPNYRGAAITFGEHQTIVNNIIFHRLSLDNVTAGSAVMLSYHWSENGDTYYTANTESELSQDVVILDSCFYKGCKDNTEGGAVSVRGIDNFYIDNCFFNDGGLSMRNIQLQNCINSVITNNKIKNQATVGTNSEGIKIDALGSPTFRSSVYIAYNRVRNAIEGIDVDDLVDAILFENVCCECTEEGISVDDSAKASLIRNLCYCCDYDGNSAGFRIESGAVVTMAQNVAFYNSTNYKIENGYSLPDGNTESIDDIIQCLTAKDVPYYGDISGAGTTYEALEAHDDDLDLIKAGTFASIYAANSSTPQEIASGSTYTKLTGLTSNGLSSNCTPDGTNSKITITRTGKYLVSGCFSLSSDTANIEVFGAAFLGGVEQSQCHFVRQIGTATDKGSASFVGIITVSETNTDLDVRFRHDNGIAVDILVAYANLSINYLGA